MTTTWLLLREEDGRLYDFGRKNERAVPSRRSPEKATAAGNQKPEREVCDLLVDEER